LEDSVNVLLSAESELDLAASSSSSAACCVASALVVAAAERGEEGQEEGEAPAAESWVKADGSAVRATLVRDELRARLGLDPSASPLVAEASAREVEEEEPARRSPSPVFDGSVPEPWLAERVDRYNNMSLFPRRLEQVCTMRWGFDVEPQGEQRKAACWATSRKEALLNSPLARELQPSLPDHQEPQAAAAGQAAAVGAAEAMVLVEGDAGFVCIDQDIWQATQATWRACSSTTPRAESPATGCGLLPRARLHRPDEQHGVLELPRALSQRRPVGTAGSSAAVASSPEQPWEVRAQTPRLRSMCIQRPGLGDAASRRQHGQFQGVRPLPCATGCRLSSRHGAAGGGLLVELPETVLRPTTPAGEAFDADPIASRGGGALSARGPGSNRHMVLSVRQWNKRLGCAADDGQADTAGRRPREPQAPARRPGSAGTPGRSESAARLGSGYAWLRQA